MTAADAALTALHDATWERDHWANVIAEGKAIEYDDVVVFKATPATWRKYAEAVAALAEAREAWAAATRGVSA